MIHIYLWKKQKIFVIFILKSNRNQEENTMSYENVKHYFDQIGMGQRVMNLKQSSATVEEAAEAIGCQPCQIAKTMSFLVNDKPILIVTAGDTKVDNKKFKEVFHQKAKMIP